MRRRLQTRPEVLSQGFLDGLDSVTASSVTISTKRCDPHHITRSERRLRLAPPNIWEKPMACPKCSSENQSSFNGEIAIHFPGLKGLDKPIVWVYAKLLVCMNCGFTEFAVPETELRRLGESAADAA